MAWMGGRVSGYGGGFSKWACNQQSVCKSGSECSLAGSSEGALKEEVTSWLEPKS